MKPGGSTMSAEHPIDEERRAIESRAPWGKPHVLISIKGKTKEKVTKELIDACREAGFLKDQPPQPQEQPPPK
jgi:hypothetical protein